MREDFYEIIFLGLQAKYGNSELGKHFNSLFESYDGGKGSGNFEHAGRPGEIGGSSSNSSKKEERLERFKGDENYPIPPLAEFLGEEFKGYKGQEAIKKLLKEKRGHIKAAFHRYDIGDINLIWGNEHGGLCHLLIRRSQDKKVKDLHDFVSDLAEVIEKGTPYKNKKYMSRINLWHKGKIVVLDSDYDGQKMNWVVTGFIKRNPPKE